LILVIAVVIIGDRGFINVVIIESVLLGNDIGRRSKTYNLRAKIANLVITLEKIITH